MHGSCFFDSWTPWLLRRFRIGQAEREIEFHKEKAAKEAADKARKEKEAAERAEKQRIAKEKEAAAAAEKARKAKEAAAKAEKERKCPQCGGEWLLDAPIHDIFYFKCDDCRLVSNISWDHIK